MKQSILLLLCIATLGLASCKKDNIYYETPNRTFNYTVQPNQWVLSADGLTLTAELGIPEFDQIALDDEGVLVYINHPVNESSFIQLPFTFNKNAYSYEHYNGGIAIDIQSSDKQAATPVRPGVIKAKIVLIPSNYTP
ncbi:hypothetical protein IWX76_003542 [Pedobacter sp. CAN_A7]|uniref:hypothetical protein n=1 Tax=Pedobacter sp. CAN_A7 TaxID=2787722 RepID=UPI0018C950F1